MTNEHVGHRWLVQVQKLGRWKDEVSYSDQDYAEAFVKENNNLDGPDRRFLDTECPWQWAMVLKGREQGK